MQELNCYSLLRKGQKEVKKEVKREKELEKGKEMSKEGSPGTGQKEKEAERTRHPNEIPPE